MSSEENRHSTTVFDQKIESFIGQSSVKQPPLQRRKTTLKQEKNVLMKKLDYTHDNFDNDLMIFSF